MISALLSTCTPLVLKYLVGHLVGPHGVYPLVHGEPVGYHLPPAYPSEAVTLADGHVVSSPI